MAKYQVSGKVTISVYTVVDADSKEKAIELASERDLCSVDDPAGHGDYAENVWVHSGELDGVAEASYAELLEG